MLIGLSRPEVTLGPVHPVIWLLLLAAPIAFVLVHRVRSQPMWWPRQTSATVNDRPDPASRGRSQPWLIAWLVSMAALSLVAGVFVAWLGPASLAELGMRARWTPLVPAVLVVAGTAWLARREGRA